MTSYDLIFNRFIKKLRNDKNFLNYTGLTNEEIEQLVKDHSIDLLNQAIGMIYENGKPDVNFYDKNDSSQTFNFDLVTQEIDLLINIMYFKYFEEDKNKLKVFGLTFSSSELNILSPANERKTFLEMINNMENNNIKAINNYLSRDRITWLLKPIKYNEY